MYVFGFDVFLYYFIIDSLIKSEIIKKVTHFSVKIFENSHFPFTFNLSAEKKAAKIRFWKRGLQKKCQKGVWLIIELELFYKKEAWQERSGEKIEVVINHKETCRISCFFTLKLSTSYVKILFGITVVILPFNLDVYRQTGQCQNQYCTWKSVKFG